MIKFNNSDIIDWNFDDSNIIKVYHNGAIVFYKFDSEQGGYKVCYAVVDDITQYSETEFEDVYDKTTEKWYKLNNLNQYEQYGVYGSGRNITTYDGKLTIDDGYEYEWNGSSWVNIGEVSGSSRVPIGYTEVEYIQNTGTTTATCAYINTGLKLYDVRGNSFSLSGRVKSEYYSAGGYNDLETIINSEGVSSPYYGFVYRYAHSRHVLELASNPSNSVTLSTTANSDGSNSIVINCNSTTVTDQVPLGLFSSYNGNYATPYRFAKAAIYSLTVVKNGDIVKDIVPCKRDSDDKYGMYDIVNDVFYVSPNGNNFIGGEPITPTEYPKYYDEIAEPLDNLTFNTLAEAQAYAEANCVYVGLKAAIDGDRYIFSGDSQSGYEWVHKPSRLPVGYTEVEYIENTGTSYINTVVYLYDTTTTSYEIEAKISSSWHNSEFEYLIATEGTSSPYNGVELRWSTHYQSGNELQCESVPKNVVYSNIDNGDGTSAVTITCSATQATNNVPLSLFCGIWSSGPWRNGKGKFYTFKLTKNNTLVRDLVPAKRNSDDKYGMYDIVNDVFYLSPNNVNFIGGDPV